MKIILASASEWRKELFSWLNLPYEVMPSDVDEQQFTWEEPSEVVATLATMKARNIAKRIAAQTVFAADDAERFLVIGADTVISLDNQIIGKPVNRQNAKEIIEKLAGRAHEVWTGLCLLDTDTEEMVVDVEKTEVQFREISDQLLEKYLDSKDWEGKAGGYQIQGAIKPFIKQVDGSITNVIGLPMQKLVSMLEEMGVYVDENVEEIVGQKTGYRD